MTQEEINKVLDAHKHYLAQDCEGWKNMRANLRGADLRWADLTGANLRGADLTEANLTGANLRGADLRWADLRGADLTESNLRGADLTEANLRGANLRSADLCGANLRWADLRGADLTEANLTESNLRWADLTGANLRGADLTESNLIEANLRGANLRGANLRGANLRGADLRWADLTGAKYDATTAFLAMACPEVGDFIAWKKVGSIIVKLRVPADAKRSSATSRKCRCEYAEVLALQNLDGTPYNGDKVVNKSHVETIYKVGEIVHPDSWDDDRWNECSHGIHFFITRDEAVRYCV